MALNVEAFIALNTVDQNARCARRALSLSNPIAKREEFDTMAVGDKKFIPGDRRIRKAWTSAAQKHGVKFDMRFQSKAVVIKGQEGVSIRRVA